jgi:hypothetical protein
MSEIRSAILKAEDHDAELVEVPEWGVTVEVRSMTARARAALQKRFAGRDEFDLAEYYADMLIAAVYDPESGEPLFEVADREALKDKSAAVLDRVSDVVTRLSGMGVGALEEAEEELGETTT